MQHIYSRHLSYKTGLLKCSNRVGGRKIGDVLGDISKKQFTDSIKYRSEDSTDPLHLLTKTVATSCDALGYTTEAAKKARQQMFALTDHFGLNTLFLTTTIDDLSSFRVRLFAQPNQEVNTY
jgi:predicted metal-dependent phosphoesterase TrpH